MGWCRAHCSSELTGKHSKPKMSTAPMKKRDSPPKISDELIASTTKSNSLEYSACVKEATRGGVAVRERERVCV